MSIPTNANDTREQQQLLSELPNAATRYLSDNLRILLEAKFEGDTYSGAPMRFSGDETKLLYQIHAYLRNQYERKSEGGKIGDSSRAGRKPDSNPSKQALYQRERRAKQKPK